MFPSKERYLQSLSDNYIEHVHIAKRQTKGFTFKEYESFDTFWNEYKTHNLKQFYEIVALGNERSVEVRPFMDIEYYDTDIKPNAFIRELKKIIIAFTKKELNKIPRILIMDSSGFSKNKKCMKYSFHVIIKKIGKHRNIYDCREFIQQLHTFIQQTGSDILNNRIYDSKSVARGIPIDFSVYKSWQLMRLPYSCTDERVLVPLLNSRGKNKPIPFDKIQGKHIKEMFITWTGNEDEYINITAPTKNKEKKKKKGTMECELPDFRTLVSARETVIKNKPKPEVITKLLACYNHERCHNFFPWVRVGLALYNYFKGDVAGLKTWIKWSKQCAKCIDKNGKSKFDMKIFPKKWKEFHKTKLKYNLGSLFHWAKLDNPKQYKLIIATTCMRRACDAMNNDYKTAQLVHEILQNEIIGYVDPKGITHWYVFNGVYLVPDYGCMYLKRKISSDIVDIYQQISDHYSQKYKQLQAETDNSNSVDDFLDNAPEESEEMSAKMAELKTLNTRIKCCAKMIRKLSSNTYKKALVDECKQFFMEPKLPTMLNCNTNIVVFENGVYDLDEGCFRAGYPEDYMSLSCQIKFNPNLDTTDIETFLKNVLYYDDVMHYTCKLLASCYSGKIIDQLFHFMTGGGANGKSTLLNILDKAFSEYFTTLKAAALIGRDSNASNASPHWYKLISKRLVCISESTSGNVNVERFKRITGNDKLSVRGLYKDEEDIRLYCKFIMICNNLLEIPAHDYATWRRIRQIDFPCKFVDKPDPNNPKEFKIDVALASPHMIMKLATQLNTLLLTKYYPLYVKEGLKSPPQRITKHTEFYHAQMNVFKRYAKIFLEATSNPNDLVEYKKLYIKFKCWYNANGFIRRNFPDIDKVRDEFVKFYFNKPPIEHTINGKKTFIWRKYKFVEEYEYDYEN